MSLKSQLIKYIDAGYPMLYINTFEEIKTDKIISSIMGGREGLEWNGAKGFVDFKTKVPNIEDASLLKTLRLLNSDEELDRKFLVLKDITSQLEDSEVVATLKDIALSIVKGLDTVVIIVANRTKIPPELEKFITILELEYPNQNEIKAKMNCQHMGGTPPFGFTVNKDTGLLVADPLTSPAVKKIFQLYAEGFPTSKICEWLKDNGYKTVKGNDFKANSLNAIFHNEKYRGCYTYDKLAEKDVDGRRNGHSYKDNYIRIENGCESLVSDKMFQKVQERLKRNRDNADRASPNVLQFLKIKLKLSLSAA